MDGSTRRATAGWALPPAADAARARDESNAFLAPREAPRAAAMVGAWWG